MGKDLMGEPIVGSWFSATAEALRRVITGHPLGVTELACKKVKNFDCPADYVGAGYRKVSNKFGVLSRIDRPDWVQVLAEHLHRSPAELYVPGRPEHPSAHWCDYYRRVLSTDTVMIDPAFARYIPNSNNDPVGFVPLH